METNGDFNLLPEDCIIHILSFTTCRDACVLSLVSSTFQSASYSDTLWEHFLPSDYASILSRSMHPVQYASKRELYFRLCDYPVQIDGDKLCFGLDKSTGAKCFTISAREMNLGEHEAVRAWKFIQTPGARFPVAARLLHDGSKTSLLLCCRIESKALTLHTTYASHLIFRLPEILDTNVPLISRVCIDKFVKFQRKVLLSTTYKKSRSKYRTNRVMSDEEFVRSFDPLYDLRLPKQRVDGWMEVEMGEFHNENLENRELTIILRKVRGCVTSGTDILGIELRPKGV